MALQKRSAASPPQTAHYEVPEFMVRSLDGSILPGVKATPGSGVVYASNSWRGEQREDPAIDFATIYAPCKEAQAKLVSTANRLCEKRRLSPLSLSASHACTWIEVEESAKRACDVFEQLAAKDKNVQPGSSGRLKKAFRGLCQNAGVGKTLISLVPDGSYTSVLCGGLKIIFDALEKSHHYRQEIYNALEELPCLLTDHSVRLHLNEEDEELHRRTAVLYTSIFELLETICKWFLQRSIVVASKATVNPAGFTAKLKDGVSRVRNAAQSFVQRLATIAEEDRQDDQQKLNIIMCMLGQIRRDQTREKLENLDALALLSRLGVLDKLSGFLNSTQDQEERKRDLASSQTPLARPPTPTPTVYRTADEILELCQFEQGTVSRDCDSIRRNLLAPGYHIDEDRIAAVQSEARLQGWIMLNESSLLAINANFEPTSSLGMSYVSAKIIEHALEVANQSVQELAPLIPLAFFCSQHGDLRDRHGRASELALGVVLQLLDRYRGFDAETVDAGFHLLNPSDAASVCDTFDFLVSRLPATAVVILVVDGLSSFGQPRQRRDETALVVERWVKTYAADHAATLKILFASATRVDFVEELVTEDELLVIPKELTSSGGYHLNQWKEEM